MLLLAVASHVRAVAVAARAAVVVVKGSSPEPLVWLLLLHLLLDVAWQGY
jgi:hypothetical protein